MHQQDVAGEARRRDHLLDEERDNVVEFLLDHPLAVVLEMKLVFELDQRIGAATRGRGLRDLARGVDRTPAQNVIPDRLQAVLRNRKRDALHRAGDTVAAFDQLGSGGDDFRLLVDARRRGGAAACRVHVHPEGVGVRAQQRFVARGQLVGILIGIVRGDGKQHRIVRVGIRMMHARLVTGRRRGDAAFPGWNRAVAVACLFAAERCQVVAKPRDLVRRQGGRGDRTAERQQQAGEDVFAVKQPCAHRSSPRMKISR